MRLSLAVLILFCMTCRSAMADFARLIVNYGQTVEFDSSFDTTNGDQINQGDSGLGAVPDSVTFLLLGPEHDANIELSAGLPITLGLNTGTYLNANRIAVGSNPKLDFGFDGVGFNDLSSTFTITQESVQAVPPAGVEFATFAVTFSFNGNGSGEFLFNTVPEPSTLALLGLASLGLLTLVCFLPYGQHCLPN